jgi:predicted TPR repeat methyltransferase
MSAFDGVEVIAYPWQVNELGNRRVAVVELGFSVSDEAVAESIRSILLADGVVARPHWVVSPADDCAEATDAACSDGQSEEAMVFSEGLELYNGGEFARAAEKFCSTLHLNPKHVNAHFNMAALCHMFNYPTLAVGHIAALLRESPDDMVAHSVLWNLVNTSVEASNGNGNSNSNRAANGHEVGSLTRLGIRVYSENYSATKSSLCLHKLVTLQGLDESNILLVSDNARYAEHIYNDMDTAFESKLVSHLGYRAPWIMHAEFLRLAAQGGWRSGPAVLLDLGCGSGLIGKIFHDSVKHGGSGSEGLAGKAAVGVGTAGTGEEGSAVGLDELVAGLARQKRAADAQSPSIGCIIGVDISPAMVKLTAACACAAVADPALDGDQLPNRTEAETDVVAGPDCGCGRCYDAAYTLDAKEALRIVATAAAGVCTTGSTGPCAPVVDMVVVADTFIYLGLLGEVFSRVRELLGPPGAEGSAGGPGWFFFTVENMDKSLAKPSDTETDAAGVSASNTTGGDGASRVASFPYEPACITDGSKPLGVSLQLLRSSARFVHSPVYIMELCALYHFRVHVDMEVVLRREGTLPVYGKIYMLSAH